VYAAGDRGAFRRCSLIAHQDTLFCGPLMPKVERDIAPRKSRAMCVESVGDCPETRARQYFEDCLIRGDIDFIFGPYRCWFERCTLVMNASGGWYTAANTAEGQDWGFVFHNCRLTGACEPGAASLGRPWRQYARTLFLACDMDEHVDPRGFQDWDSWDGIRPVTHRYGEWGTTGVRADLSTRHPGAKRLTDAEAAAVTPGAVFGGWRPDR
jgi:pectinesterase